MSNSPITTFKELPQDRAAWPILGSAVAFYKDMLACQQRMYAEVPDGVIQTRLLSERPVLLFTPEAHQWVLHNRDGVFSSWGGWERFIDRMFPGAIIAMDGDNHRYQRRIMQVAFKKPVLAGYLSIMNPVVSERLSLWESGTQMQVYPSIKRLLLEIAAPTFLGQSLDAKADAVMHSFIDCVEATLALIRTPIPPFKTWKGVRARKRLEHFFMQLLPERRASESADIFSQFCQAESEEGERYTDKEIIDHLIFLMMAAHDTTSSALTTLIYNLGKNPAWQSRLRAEALSVDAALSYDQLDKLELMSAAMKESMRLYPPVPVVPRRLTADAEFSGYKFKQGTLVSLCTIHMHHNPEHWSDPERFDPERFCAPREEHKQHRFQFVPFGGGAHMCMGQHFAEMQVKVIMNQLLRKYSWELDPDYTMPYQQVPLPKPKDGLPLIFKQL